MNSRATPSGARALRVAFLGTPAVAVPTLERLIASRHEVVVVVTQPDRGRGRGRKTSPCPVAQVALDAGIPLLRPEKVSTPEMVAALAGHAPDIGVVVAFGQYIGKRVRELPSLGYMINAHASLLPRYRGASPIAQAILDGEKRTGISVMRVEREMDAGAIALVREIEIDPTENTAELTERLAQLAAEAIEAALEQIASGRVQWTEQDPSRATIAAKIGKADAVLHWDRSASELVRRVHAMAPRPGAHTWLPAGLGEAGPLRILRARVAANAPSAESEPPGTLRRDASDDAPVRIATGDGWLVPLEVQRAGGRAMSIQAFLRGRDLPDGIRLGDPGEPQGDRA